MDIWTSRVVLLALLVPVPAVAQTRVAPSSSIPRFSDRPFQIQGRYGIDTLVGLVGLTGCYDLHENLGFGAGVGTNMAGRQLAVFVRGRPVTWVAKGFGWKVPSLSAIGIEAGLSSGPARDPPLGLGEPSVGPSGDRTWREVDWLQGELQYERRFSSGFTMVLGVGVAAPVRHTGFRCGGEADWCRTHAVLTHGVWFSYTNTVAFAF
jgi:hypothetical protein